MQVAEQLVQVPTALAGSCVSPPPLDCSRRRPLVPPQLLLRVTTPEVDTLSPRHALCSAVYAAWSATFCDTAMWARR
mgnify:CR=1 FL=1